jgi:flagellar biosynthesis protein FlhG
MLDQANDLRRLATMHGRMDSARAARRPALLAITGGKGGVGTTSTAMSLATSLGRIGKHTLLIDADPLGGDVALRCGVGAQHTLADLLAGRCVWKDGVQLGPNGIQVVAGARWSDDLGSRVPVAAELLIELLNDRGDETDVAVIDVGNRPGRAGQRLCQAADAVVMVTTGDAPAVVGAFESIKKLVPLLRDPAREASEQTVPLHLLVSMARTAAEAKVVAGRLSRACRRFLGVELLDMDMAGKGLAVLRTAALFARFQPHSPTRRPQDQFCSLSENC